MITAKQHQNRALVSITDGKLLGEIKDLFLDDKLNKVVAVFTGSEGLIGRKNFVVARADIQVFGEDVWLVKGSDTVQELKKVANSEAFVLASSLRGRELHSEGGTRLAVIEDVILDEEADILGFTLGKVFAQGPLAERKTLARTALLSLGSKDLPMVTNLATAETAGIP